MNNIKIVLGISLISLIPLHWLIQGPAIQAYTIAHILSLILWIILSIAGIKLIIEGVNDNI